MNRNVTQWERRLNSLIPLLGHRNWIVVADSAYPFQSNPGIETIATGASHLKVLDKAVRGIRRIGHVRAHVYTDQELKLVAEDDAPGVDGYRMELGRLLAGIEVRESPHEEIISRLNHAGALFRILILKTSFRIPYTSVFLELDCGYWNAEAEARLRALLADSDRVG